MRTIANPKWSRGQPEPIVSTQVSRMGCMISVSYNEKGDHVG